MEKVNLWVVLLLLILPVRFTIWGITYLWQIKLLSQYKGRIMAKVTDIRKYVCFNRVYTKVTLYFFTFQYCIDEIVYNVELKWGDKNNNKYPLGTEIEIQYNEKNPAKFLVSGEEKEWKKEANKVLIYSGIQVADRRAVQCRRNIVSPTGT